MRGSRRNPGEYSEMGKPFLKKIAELYLKTVLWIFAYSASTHMFLEFLRLFWISMMILHVKNLENLEFYNFLEALLKMVRGLNADGVNADVTFYISP